VWVFAMAIRVTAQRPQWPLKSVWRWDSTGYAALWRTVKPTVNAPSAYASKSVLGSSHWSRAPVPCGKSWKWGANSTARCPSCSKNLAVRVRSRRDTGTGLVSFAPWKWNTLMDGSRSKSSVFSSCPPAN
jgi:hypothetical protein